MKTSGWFLLPFVLGGCCTTKEPASPPGTADMSAVIDRVKVELNKFKHSLPVAPPNNTTTCTVNGKPNVFIVPTKAELTLKVASTNNIAGSIGVKIPAGKIVTVDPTFSGSYQTVGTHAFTLNLDLQHDPSVSELQTDIDTTSKQIAVYAKAQKALAKTDPATAAKFGSYVAAKSAHLHGDYAALAGMLPQQASAVAEPPDTPASFVDATKRPPVPNPPDDLADYPLASTLWTVREQLLYVDHMLTPCVKPNQLEVDIDFEVQAKMKADVGLDILIVSIDASNEKTNDTLQHLKVTFDMTGSSQLLLLNTN